MIKIITIIVIGLLFVFTAFAKICPESEKEIRKQKLTCLHEKRGNINIPIFKKTYLVLVKYFEKGKPFTEKECVGYLDSIQTRGQTCYRLIHHKFHAIQQIWGIQIYKKGEPHGLWAIYDSDGKINKIVFFEDEQSIGLDEENGDRLFLLNRKDGVNKEYIQYNK